MPAAPEDRLVTVWATAQLEGWHRWPDAHPERYYLAARHRHLFGFRVEVAVGHADRAVEFHDLRDLIVGWWVPEQGRRSCEAIADGLWSHLELNHRLTVVAITVDEDGQNGATIRGSRPTNGGTAAESWVEVV